MNKELTPLEIVKRWKAQIHWNKDFGWDKEIASVEKELADAEKYKKALEIIKEKRVDTLLLFRCFELDNLYGHSHFETYNQELYTQNITQEEYDFLKEILK